jgi:DNA-3-methyladenine glycosylase II
VLELTPVFPTELEVAAARKALAAEDPLMVKADAAVPPLAWRARTGGFEGLVRQIVGQQVSIAASAAILARLIEGVGGALTPQAVLGVGEDRLRSFGLSRQKAGYVRAIVEAGDLFAEMHTLSDEDAAARLMAIKGVGRWTAETYLMFSEGRLDFFPAGDIALQEGLRLLEEAPARLSEKALYERAQAWAPYRGVAALLLWSYYSLSRSGALTEAGAP